MGNEISLDHFHSQRNILHTHIAGVLRCMGLGPDLAIVQREKDAAVDNRETWANHLRDLRTRHAAIASVGRVEVVVVKLLSLWSPTRCQFKSVDDSVFAELTQAGKAPEFDYEPIDRELQECKNRFLYVSVVWVWAASETESNFHHTLLLFDRTKRSLEYFDPTDGHFVYYNPRARAKSGNRWLIMKDHILPHWKRDSWKYLDEQTSASLSPVQAVIEDGWREDEAYSVLGYCTPIVLLVHTLCMRMNLVSPTVAAIGLADYVTHHFADPIDREDFRAGLMIWYQRLYNAGSFKSICERIGLRKEPFSTGTIQFCAMYTNEGMCQKRGYGEWTICKEHRDEMIVMQSEDLTIPHYPHDETWDEETDEWVVNSEAAEDLAEVRAGIEQKRQVKLERDDKQKRQKQ